MATRASHHLPTVVGHHIATARRERGLTQQQLATDLGTSISRVSSWENGRHLPGQRHRITLADQLFDGDVTAMFREPDTEAA